MAVLHGPQPGEATRIMVVDDNTDRRGRTLEFFRRRGYEVLAARSGVEAIAHIIQHRVDVILIQGSLPGLSSYETIPIVKKIHPALRVILTLPGDVEPEPHPTEQTDFIHCFLEPIRLEEIERAIREPGAVPKASGP
ncbi:MAG: response regulator [candidate division NC10 bacterium]|nr:response regulator [candidate division NC10 bacterium]